MKRTSSEPERKYFCNEPWTGVFTVLPNRDVLFCPCYMKRVIGNLDEASMQEIWNADEMIKLRRTFARGKLPRPCRGQLCPPALGEGPQT